MKILMKEFFFDESDYQTILKFTRKIYDDIGKYLHRSALFASTYIGFCVIKILFRG
jgi:hypothetical protein